MTMKNNTSKLFVTVGAAFALIFGVLVATPPQAHAFQLGQLIDPGCFFACDSGGGRTVKNITNYGNYQSPGGIVAGGNVTTGASSAGYGTSYGYNVPSNSATYNNYTYSSNYSAAPVVTTPTYSYYSNQPIAYAQPTYQPVYAQPAYPPLYVSCSANSDYGTVGAPVTWTAYASGGAGYYTYTWSGTDGLYGNGQSVYFTYQVPGYKTASVTVYSSGQTFTENCGNGISIGGAYYAQPVVAQPVPVPVYPVVVPKSTNYNGLDIGCYADPVTATPNQPVTWNVEVTGGVGPYSYSWTGTDGLSGSAASVIKYYSAAGTKNAVVTVTSADGRNSVHACSNSIKVRSTAAPKPAAKPTQTQTTTTSSNTGLSAAALFSLSSIPWGWVSVLVILVLFATVVYLLFNKPKI